MQIPRIRIYVWAQFELQLLASRSLCTGVCHVDGMRGVVSDQFQVILIHIFLPYSKSLVYAKSLCKWKQGLYKPKSVPGAMVWPALAAECI